MAQEKSPSVRTNLEGRTRRPPRLKIRADNGGFCQREGSLNPLLRRGRKITKRVNFFVTDFLAEPDLRLFLRDRHVIGLSGFFGPRVFPLGSAWKSPVLEMVCLDSRSGFILGDFLEIFSQWLVSLIISIVEVARSCLKNSFVLKS